MEEIAKGFAAFGRDEDGPGIGHSAEPAVVEHFLKDGGAEGAGEVGPAFGPVETGSGEAAAFTFKGLTVYAEFVEPADAFGGRGEIISGVLEEVLFDQRFCERHPYPAGEMIVAGATGANGRIFLYGRFLGFSG